MVAEIPVEFKWHPGMSASQKKRNVASLHEAASSRGLPHLLEISSKSDREIGRRLSAFHQTVLVGGSLIPLESAFQGSKIFERGGPYFDVLTMSARDAKSDPRLRNSGRLIGFEISGTKYPTRPVTAFYDWMYTKSIFPARNWLKRLGKMDGFTDIEFNPEKSINCQARSCALFIALEKRGLLDEAMSSFQRFVELNEGSYSFA